MNKLLGDHVDLWFAQKNPLAAKPRGITAHLVVVIPKLAHQVTQADYDAVVTATMTYANKVCGKYKNDYPKPYLSLPVFVPDASDDQSYSHQRSNDEMTHSLADTRTIPELTDGRLIYEGVPIRIREINARRTSQMHVLLSKFPFIMVVTSMDNFNNLPLDVKAQTSLALLDLKAMNEVLAGISRDIDVNQKFIDAVNTIDLRQLQRIPLHSNAYPYDFHKDTFRNNPPVKRNKPFQTLPHKAEPMLRSFWHKHRDPVTGAPLLEKAGIKGFKPAFPDPIGRARDMVFNKHEYLFKDAIQTHELVKPVKLSRRFASYRYIVNVIRRSLTDMATNYGIPERPEGGVELDVWNHRKNKRMQDAEAAIQRAEKAAGMQLTCFVYSQGKLYYHDSTYEMMHPLETLNYDPKKHVPCRDLDEYYAAVDAVRARRDSGIPTGKLPFYPYQALLMDTYAQMEAVQLRSENFWRMFEAAFPFERHNPARIVNAPHRFYCGFRSGDKELTFEGDLHVFIKVIEDLRHTELAALAAACKPYAVSSLPVGVTPCAYAGNGDIDYFVLAFSGLDDLKSAIMYTKNALRSNDELHTFQSVVKVTFKVNNHPDAPSRYVAGSFRLEFHPQQIGSNWRHTCVSSQ